MVGKNLTRINFGKTEKNLPKLDLILVQKESWLQFLTQGIAEELSEVFPIDDFTGKNWQLHLEQPELGEAVLTPAKAIEKGLTYAIPLKILATLVNKHSGSKVSQEVYLGEIPQMTTRGTFIINGIERTVNSQLVRSPGVYFSGELDSSSGRTLYTAEVRPLHGSWLEFEVSKNNVISARIDRRRKVNAATLLRAFGVESDSELISLFKDVDTDTQHKYISATIDKDPSKNKDEAVLEIYKKMRPGEPVLLDNAQNLFTGMFLDNRRYNLGKVGRFKINKRLALNLPNDKNTWVLTKQDTFLIKSADGN